LKTKIRTSKWPPGSKLIGVSYIGDGRLELVIELPVSIDDAEKSCNDLEQSPPMVTSPRGDSDN